jgi:hypothetical protein
VGSDAKKAVDAFRAAGAGHGTVRAPWIAPSARPWASGLPKRRRQAGARMPRLARRQRRREKDKDAIRVRGSPLLRRTFLFLVRWLGLRRRLFSRLALCLLPAGIAHHLCDGPPKNQFLPRKQIVTRTSVPESGRVLVHCAASGPRFSRPWRSHSPGKRVRMMFVTAFSPLCSSPGSAGPMPGAERT